MDLNKKQTLDIIKKGIEPLFIRHFYGIAPNGENGHFQHVYDAYKKYLLTIWRGVTKGGAFYRPHDIDK